MKFQIFYLFLLLPLFACTQNYSLKGTISGLESQKVTLSDFYGNEDKIIDSVFTDKQGRFNYTFGKDMHAGMYRLRFGEQQFMDIIYQHENIRFQSQLNALIDSLIFEQSRENQIYFDYLNRRNEMEYKLELIGPVMAYYPKTDNFYESATDEFDETTEDFDNYINNLIKKNPDTYAARIIKSDYTPRPPRDMEPQNAMNYMRAHFFDNVDFADTSLLYSTIFSAKVMQYLSFYQNNRMGKDQLEVEFIKAVSKIMEVTGDSPPVYEYAMNYLIGGFESYGFERVITYIADNVNLDESCVNSERKAELEKKVESLKRFSVGKKAPDFTTTDLNGNKITLSALNAEYTLVVFWATWCPHCTRLIPELSQIYFPESRDKLEIVSISLDDSQADLEAFLEAGDYPWINISDFKKWQGSVVQQYDIYATPTMFLLFNDLTILAKPMTFEELKNELFERNILH